MLTNKLMGKTGEEKQFVEDLFSTYLYTGNGSTQTITNGIDLAGKGGMVWFKNRGTAANHLLLDSARTNSGYYEGLSSNTTAGNTSLYGFQTSSTGFLVDSAGLYNTNGNTYASWTFRKAPKFFDVVTYTGNGAASQTINHSLGQAPGMVIVKNTSSTGNWNVYHRSLGATKAVFLDSTSAALTGVGFWNNTAPTASSFTVGTNLSVNGNGQTFVAYLFAHDTSTDGLIQCGSFTTDGSGNATVNLGWEPQYLFIKPIDSGSWNVYDTMRGWSVANNTSRLIPNLTAAEQANLNFGYPTATGFYNTSSGPDVTFIYMAIRRGPMKTPTDPTKVFAPVAYTGTGATNSISSVGFSPDATIIQRRNSGYYSLFFDKLRGPLKWLASQLTNAEGSDAGTLTSLDQNGFTIGTSNWTNWSTYLFSSWNFKRAPGFFDVVCYTGTGVARDINHNLEVVPEFYIVKQRAGGSDTTGWATGGTVYPNSTDYYTPLLNTNQAQIQVANAWRTPTTTTFGIGSAYPNDNTWNKSGATYVAYLFASCPGVSKVFNFTGNGSSQTINCGFTGGARFVLIKRTDSTGDWYVWDTARGVVTGNDPHLSLNSTSAEVTTDDTIDPDSTGFIVNQVAATNVNVNGASYIGLAIA